MARELTGKQKAFVAEYLVDLNATQAVIRAGYSSKRNADKIGSQLLGNTRVYAAIQDAMAARESRTEITQDYVLVKIRDTIERCSGEDEFNPQSIMKGCELLGKHLGLFERDNRQRNPADAVAAVIAEIQANSKRTLPGGGGETA